MEAEAMNKLGSGGVPLLPCLQQRGCDTGSDVGNKPELAVCEFCHYHSKQIKRKCVEEMSCSRLHITVLLIEAPGSLWSMR